MAFFRPRGEAPFMEFRNVWIISRKFSLHAPFAKSVEIIVELQNNEACSF